MPRAKDDNTIDYLRNAYLRVKLSHPSAAGADRLVEETNAEEFALIILRYAQDDSVRISVNDRALHKMRKRVEAMWEMPHHREASKDGSRESRKEVKNKIVRRKVRRKVVPGVDQETVDSSRHHRRSNPSRVSSRNPVERDTASAQRKLERMRARRKAKKK